MNVSINSFPVGYSSFIHDSLWFPQKALRRPLKAHIWRDIEPKGTQTGTLKETRIGIPFGLNSSIHKIQIPCKLPIGFSQLELAFQNGVSRFGKLFVHYWTLKGPIRRSCTYVQSSCASSHMVPLIQSFLFPYWFPS